MRKLNGKTALLTGATGGLVPAIARSLGERGVKLALSGRNPQALANVAGELGAQLRTPVATAAADLVTETLPAASSSEPNRRSARSTSSSTTPRSMSAPASTA